MKKTTLLAGASAVAAALYWLVKESASTEAPAARELRLSTDQKLPATPKVLVTPLELVPCPRCDAETAHIAHGRRETYFPAEYFDPPLGGGAWAVVILLATATLAGIVLLFDEYKAVVTLSASLTWLLLAPLAPLPMIFVTLLIGQEAARRYWSTRVETTVLQNSCRRCGYEWSELASVDSAIIEHRLQLVRDFFAQHAFTEAIYHASKAQQLIECNPAYRERPCVAAASLTKGLCQMRTNDMRSARESLRRALHPPASDDVREKAIVHLAAVDKHLADRRVSIDWDMVKKDVIEGSVCWFLAEFKKATNSSTKRHLHNR